MNKKMLIGVLLIAVLAVGGYYFYQSSGGSGVKGNIFTTSTGSTAPIVSVYDDFGVKSSNVGVRMVSDFDANPSMVAGFSKTTFQVYDKTTGAILTNYRDCANTSTSPNSPKFYDLTKLNGLSINLTKQGGYCTDACGEIKLIPDNTQTSQTILSIFDETAKLACYSSKACSVKTDTFHALLKSKVLKFADLKKFYTDNLTVGGCAVSITDLNEYKCFEAKDIFATAVSGGDYDSAKIAFGKIAQISGCALGASDAAALADYGKLGSADKCKDLKDQLKAAFDANKDSATIASLLNQIKNQSNCDSTVAEKAAYDALLAKEKCDKAQLNLKNFLDNMPKDSSVQPSDALASGIAYLSIKAMVPTCTLSSTLASTYNTQVCSMINNSFTKKDTAKDVSGALAVVSTAGKVGCITTTPVVANAFMKTNNTNVCKKLGTDFMTAKAGSNSAKMTSIKKDGTTLGCNMTSWR
ncbi:MAG: hypothetical protein US89_C0002G0082 [Candidatus Peregrinibacteria bacterium GW2011_GWF2_38_29]|nr:MAG: hypothetical protein US89_C0002G0082 [Candidatus Peregrinibacteria bacterium GW2011_GWF2_38_29]HBB02240.1 hypothetical protein [Candidatus Peregrinibacteria bacterium]